MAKSRFSFQKIKFYFDFMNQLSGEMDMIN